MAALRGESMAEVEVFTPTGVLSGQTARVPLSSNGPDLTSALAVREGRWFPLDGGQAERRRESKVPPDDILLIVTPHPAVLVHMTWYSVVLDLGPYRVTGELATQPGFDPERALARPGGTFVPLRDARIELVADAGVGAADRSHVHVNRYAVERVVASLMLGHYFPGARLLTPATVAAD
jgi:hypothetical protein